MSASYMYGREILSKLWFDNNFLANIMQLVFEYFKTDQTIQTKTEQRCQGNQEGVLSTLQNGTRMNCK